MDLYAKREAVSQTEETTAIITWSKITFMDLVGQGKGDVSTSRWMAIRNVTR